MGYNTLLRFIDFKLPQDKGGLATHLFWLNKLQANPKPDLHWIRTIGPFTCNLDTLTTWPFCNAHLVNF